MDVTRFSLLTALERRGRTPLSYPALAEEAALPSETVERALPGLLEEGLVCLQKKGVLLADTGLQALEPYRVRRAIIMAAGFGSRLRPLTNQLPKPLVPVRGVPMVETLLQAFAAVGIEEVHLVRGYRGEAFDTLAERHPSLHLIDNPDFAKTNNISSALCARQFFAGAYVCDGDLYLKNPKLIRKYELHSNYLGCATPQTDDWRFHISGDRILSASVGGRNCYRMAGISYWSEEDGKHLSTDLERVYKLPDGSCRFWDEVALHCSGDRYHIHLRPCREGEICEVDTLEDLIRLDPSYRKYLQPGEIRTPKPLIPLGGLSR